MDITFHVSNHTITHLLQLYTKQTLVLSCYSVMYGVCHGFRPKKTLNMNCCLDYEHVYVGSTIASNILRRRAQGDVQNSLLRRLT